MGFLGSIFGKKPQGYTPNHTSEYDDQTYNAIQDRQNNPLTGQSGVNKATSGFDYSPTDKAIQGYSNPEKLTQTYNPSSYGGANFNFADSYKPQAYNPYQFDFKSLPQQYGQQSYDLGAKNIRNEGAGQLQQLQESMGTRSPGLLMKSGQQAQRNTGEQLGSLGGQIGLETMRQNIAQGTAQQQAQAGENMNAAQFGEGQQKTRAGLMGDQQKSQAGENLGAAQFNAGEGYKGYQSQSDLEKGNSDNTFRNLGALNSAGEGKIATQSGLLQNQRDYQDKYIQMLQNAFAGSAGIKNQTAGIAMQGRGQDLQLLGSLAGAASSAAKGAAFA